MNIKRLRECGLWYQRIHDYIYSHYDRPELFCNLLAATSPRTSVLMNWRYANQVYKDRNNYKGLMPVHIANIKRAYNNEPLSGNKVKSFAENLKGNYDAVTIDVWMLRFLGINKTSVNEKLYNKLAEIIREQAKKEGLKPAEYQAICWTYIRSGYGYKYSDFMLQVNQLQLNF